MKIFSYLNLSNPSNLEADSGFIFQSLLFKAILSLKPNTTIYFLCAKNTPIIDKRVKNIPRF
jgi:hypothetical protein